MKFDRTTWDLQQAEYTLRRAIARGTIDAQAASKIESLGSNGRETFKAQLVATATERGLGITIHNLNPIMLEMVYGS